MEILVATDGSERSLRAIPHAVRLARAARCSIRFITVDEARDRRAAEITNSDLEAVVSEVTGTFDVPCGSTVVHTESGESVEDVLLREQEAQGGLLMLTTRGAGVIRRALFGSVATAVLARTKHPLMLVGPHVEPPQERESEPYRLIATIDQWDESELVLPAISDVLANAAPETVEVAMLHIFRAEGADAKTKDEADDYLRDMEEAGAALPPALDRFEVVREVSALTSTDAAIIEAADDFQADSIWMATHAQSFARHLVSGSTSLAVLGRGVLPVVLVPAGPPED